MIERSLLRTGRLSLRPSEIIDAERAIEIQSNWNVTRNLRMASFPPDRAGTEAWFAGHEREWRDGTAYRFAILLDGHMIGLVDVDEIANGEGSLGYWLEEAAWGRGYAFEAAQALVRFSFDTVRLAALTSGHAADNVNSGRILTRLGFMHTGDGRTFSKSRATAIVQRRYRLVRESPSPPASV
ncbi:MAG: GNAT family N-acetyltransferase [Alphaproteobacteria bacterium]|nr:GNAT family N-acetyltransferase [Alphaproteobacteria bacterium]MBL6938647.1 GNAT family N-acetyltransferase [Alphaproteobacteria bacterium]MBL7097996.1 GNAT family N-acetyltransferase [Alphaproteobacteria bacterium]